jgi:hypothetical protein
MKTERMGVEERQQPANSLGLRKSNVRPKERKTPERLDYYLHSSSSRAQDSCHPSELVSNKGKKFTKCEKSTNLKEEARCFLSNPRVVLLRVKPHLPKACDHQICIDLG